MHRVIRNVIIYCKYVLKFSVFGLDNLKIEVEDLDVDKLKTFPVDLKELSDVVSKEVVKNSKFN